MKGFERLVRRACSQQTRSFESPLNNNKNKNPHFFISRRGFIHASSSSSTHLDHQLHRSRFASLKSSPVSPLPFRKWGLLGGQKRGMFIQTQSTPNPSSLIFYPGKPIVEVGSADFPNARSAMSSPLAKALYGIDGQKRGLKTLCRFKGKSAGRNSSGRITIFHRGGGAKRLQRSIDLKRSTSSMGIVERIEYDPNRSSRIALVRWTEGVHLPRQRSNTVEEFAPPRKIFDPNTTTVRGLFSFSSLPGIFQVDQSKKSSAREVFISAFSSPKAKGDTTPLSFPRVAVAGANPAFLAPRMREKLKGEDSSPCEVQKWRPCNSILWAHRIKRKAALSWQSSRQKKSLGLAAKTAAAKHAATH